MTKETEKMRREFTGTTFSQCAEQYYKFSELHRDKKFEVVASGFTKNDSITEYHVHVEEVVAESSAPKEVVDVSKS